MSDLLEPRQLRDVLDAPPAGPLALAVTAETTDAVDQVMHVAATHVELLADRCVGLAVVAPAEEVRRAVLRRAGRVAFPLTAVPTEELATGWLTGQLAAGLHGVRPAGTGRNIGLGPRLADYVDAHLNPPRDPLVQRLLTATQERFGARVGMCVGEDQGRLLQLLVELSAAAEVVEVGTFTGSSALWLARGLPPGGRLRCFEVDPEPLELAQRAWREAGVEERITVTVGPAAEGLAALPGEPSVDLAFVDADKGGYATYVELLLPRLRPGGLLLIDNTLWGGAVADERVDDRDTRAIRALNDRLAEREDLAVLVLPVGDGLTVVRHRREA